MCQGGWGTTENLPDQSQGTQRTMNKSAPPRKQSQSQIKNPFPPQDSSLLNFFPVALQKRPMAVA